MVRQGSKVLVLCGPSGSGKSSLLRLLFEEFPEKFGFSVSHTTRSPRPGEENGKHYYFTTKEEMELAISRGEFLESAVFSNNMYGTSLAAVQSVCESGKVCVLDIDVEGVKQVKKTDLKPLFVFIKPPSLADLETRLRGRNTETEDSLQRRLDTARKEMVYGEAPGNFDFVLVNDNLEKAYNKFKGFVIKELEKSEEKNASHGLEMKHMKLELRPVIWRVLNSPLGLVVFAGIFHLVLERLPPLFFVWALCTDKVSLRERGNLVITELSDSS